MRIIDKISKQYPTLDLESIRILLCINEHAGFCVREIAQILGLDEKSVQLKIALMSEGRKGRKSRKLHLINSDYKISDQRKRDLMLTCIGRDLADRLKSLTAKYTN